MTVRPVVWYASRGPAIGELQALLAARGLYVPRAGYEDPSDHFGPVTDAAVRAFQTLEGLEPDGTVDSYVWQLLDT